MKNNGLTINKEAALTTAEKDRSACISPAVDIFETDHALTLVADLPGVSKEQLELGIERNLLTIEGLPAKELASNHRYREFGGAGYYRRFQLPDNLDLDQASAELKDGVLTLTLPKAAAAKPRRIEVTVH